MKLRLPVAAAVLAATTIAAVGADVPYFRWRGNGGATQGATTPDPSATPDTTTPVSPTPATLSMTYTGADATIGYPMSARPVLTSAPTNARYRIAKGTLPSWAQFDTASGLITGSPPEAGSTTLTVEVEDLDTNKTTTSDVVLRSLPVDTVAASLPSVAFSGVDATAAAYDVLPATVVGSGSGQEALLTFDRARTADSVEVVSTGGFLTWTLEANTASGWTTVATDTSPSTRGFNAPATAQAFRLRFNGTLGGFRVLYAGTGAYAPSVNAPQALSARAGSPVIGTLSASNTQGPTAWEVVSGSLPPNVKLGADGTLSGASTAVGTFRAEVAVRDARTRSATATLTIAIQAQDSASTLFPASVSRTQVATYYDASLATTDLLPAGQTLGITFDRPVRANKVIADIAGGTTPLSIEAQDPSNGAWSTLGTIDASNLGGSFATASATSWRVRAGGQAATIRTLRIAEDSAPIAPSVAAVTYRPEIGLDYNQALAAADLSGQATWTQVSGSPPPGTQLVGNLVKGQPTTAGNSQMVVTVTDPRGVVSVPSTITFDTQVQQTAATLFPATVNGSASNVAAIYDADTSNASQIMAQTALVLDFGRAISADGWTVDATNPIVVDYLDNGTWKPMAQGTSVSVSQYRARVSNGNYTNFKTFRMTKGSSAPVAPSLNPTAQNTSVTRNQQSASILNLGGGYAQNTSGTATYQLASGTLPTGVQWDATGLISGKPTQTGNFAPAFTVTDARGVVSVPQTYNLRVLSELNASNVFPTAVAGLAGNVARIFDNDSSTTVRFTYQQANEYTYADEVTVDTVYGPQDYNTASDFTLSYLDVNTQEWSTPVAFRGGATTRSVQAVSSNRFRVTYNSNSIDWDVMRLGYGGTTPIAPSVVKNQTRTVVAGTAMAAFQPQRADTTGAVTYAIDKALLPPGTDPGADGTITGTPTTPGTYTFPVTVRDVRGLASIPQNVTITVQSQYTANLEMPATVGGSADMRSGLYDASAGTTYTLAQNSNTDFVFAHEVRVDSFDIDVGYLGMRLQAFQNGAWVDIATSNGAAGWMSIPLTSATTFRVFNNTGTRQIARMRFGYGGNSPSAPSVTSSAASTSMVIGTAGTAFTLTPANPSGSQAYAVTGNYPPGLAPPTNAGVISGTPTTAGTYNFFVSTSSNGVTSVPLALTVTVSATPLPNVAKADSVTTSGTGFNASDTPQPASQNLNLLYDATPGTYVETSVTKTTVLKLNWNTAQVGMDCARIQISNGGQTLSLKRTYTGGSDSVSFVADNVEKTISFPSPAALTNLEVVVGDVGNIYVDMRTIKAGYMSGGACVTP